MNRRTTYTLRTTAVSAAILFGSVAVAGPAAAAGGDVDVVNTETVQVYTSPTGKVDSKRLYEQLSLTGSGTVDLQNPVATDGLRNLDGFKGLDVSKGNQVVKMSVDGKQRLRSLSDFDGSCRSTSRSPTSSTARRSTPRTSWARTASSRSATRSRTSPARSRS